MFFHDLDIPVCARRPEQVFVPSQCPGMARTASGRILGWGTEWNAGDPEFYPMLKARVTAKKYRSNPNAWLCESVLVRGCNACA